MGWLIEPAGDTDPQSSYRRNNLTFEWVDQLIRPTGWVGRLNALWQTSLRRYTGRTLER
jgi:hypothetical protein